MKPSVKRQFDRRDFVKSIGAVGAAAAGIGAGRVSSPTRRWRRSPRT